MYVQGTGPPQLSRLHGKHQCSSDCALGGWAGTHFPQHSKGRQTFTFDRVFNWDTSQTEVFNYAARHVVDGTAGRLAAAPRVVQPSQTSHLRGGS